MIKVFAQTDVGRVRERNEDNFLVVDTTSEHHRMLPEIRVYAISDQGLFLMVSDGMGGAAAGEVASILAVKTARNKTKFNKPLNENQFVKQLIATLEAANHTIEEHTYRNPELRGMGATATLAGIFKNKVFIGQVGDSRAYLLRNRQIQLMTRDQSFVNQLLEAGKITEEEAKTHPRRNVILQALGNQEKLDVPVTSFSVQVGDYLLLCSDGLSNEVNEDEICQIISETKDLQIACQQLIELANDRGGRDNITVILAQFIDKNPSETVVSEAEQETPAGPRFSLPRASGKSENPGRFNLSTLQTWLT